MRALLFRRRYEALALGCAVFFVALQLLTDQPAVAMSDQDIGAVHRLVQSFEARITSILFRLRGEQPAHPELVLVELDERGAERFGVWPWRRAVTAKIIERLLDANAKVIGLDMGFIDEANVDPGSRELLEKLAAAGELPPALAAVRDELVQRLAVTDDDELERVLRKGGPRIVQGVVPISTLQRAELSEAQLTRYRSAATIELITRTPGKQRGSWFELDSAKLAAWTNEGVQTPLPRFAKTGTHLGHFGTVIDLDGAIRRHAALTRLIDPPGLFPSMALRTAAVALDASIEPIVEDHELRGVRLRSERGDVMVPVQGDVPYTMIDYPGPERSFARLSAVDVYDGAFDAAKVAGKTVLMGVTITGSSGDQRVTPFREFSPGLYTHASMVSNILTNRFLDRPQSLEWLEPLLILALVFAIALVTPRTQSFVLKMVVLVAVLGAWSLATYVAFTRGLKVSWFVPTMALLVTAFGTVFLGYLSVDREKLKLRATFSRYLGEDVMALALENPERLNQGEKREMTVLFSDIRGFTSISEHMSPEKLATFINEYLSPMTKIVFDEKGTLDKYIGDAVMAFWNAPLDQPDHAMRACRAAVAMLEKLEQLKAGWRAAGFPELEIGIGINTGTMVVGNMGSDVRVDYTVLGDAVNLASRLEGTNKEYDTRIIISESTWAQCRDQIVSRRLGAVRVKGRRLPVGIFELRGLGKPGEGDAQAIAAFEGALTAWSARKFDEAEQRFNEVLALWPNDAPTRRYLAELDGIKRAPPAAEWDGVVSLKTK